MKIRPILFNKEMVKAIMNGAKNQTRRIVKPQPTLSENVGFCQEGYCFGIGSNQRSTDENFISCKAKYQKGDVLWVRETWQLINSYKTGKEEFIYRADGENDEYNIEDWQGWKPSIFMPKKACRLFLKVKNVRIERLHDISDEDSKNEGIYITDDYWGEKAPLNYMCGEKDGFKHQYFFGDAPYVMEKVPSHSGWKASFFTLWWSINGKESLEENPWVWVYDFETIVKPESFKQ